MAESDVPANADANAIVNDPNEEVVLYTRSGIALKVKRSEAHQAILEHDLIETQYDLDLSAQEWHADYVAVEDAVMRLIADVIEKGYVPDDAEAAANAAWGKVVQSYQTLQHALGAKPTEALMAAWAEHKREHDGIDLAVFPKMWQAKNAEEVVSRYVEERKSGGQQ